MTVILASASQRRCDLMKMMGIDFLVRPSDADEDVLADSPEDMVKKLALKKARHVFAQCEDRENTAVVGADTIVVLNGDIIGKPKDEQQAFETLKRLSGQTHIVYTGVAVLRGELEICDFDAAHVTFSTPTDEELLRYIATGEPMDKAGSYGLQGRFSVFVPRICGSYFTVVGLPVHLLYNQLKRVGAV